MMAADVSCLVRMMNGGDSNESASSGKSTAPITRDLLGGCCTLDDTKELDLDLQVPCGWEKRLDLKSGNVYLQRCNSSNSSSSTSDNKPQSSKAFANFQDLNFPPPSKQTLNFFDESSLELKLVSSLSVSSPTTSNNYQSVCTLDKVKFALERAEKETVMRKRSISLSKSSSPRSNSSCSIKDTELIDVEEKSSGSFAAGCPCCLMYVLISKSNPRCPRCNSNVPLPLVTKKPRIDLNMSI